MDVKAGETHYVRFAATTYPSPGVAASWEVGEVSPATGQQEIVTEKFQAPDKKMPEAFKP
jgi:hypothetical protein